MAQTVWFTSGHHGAWQLHGHSHGSLAADPRLLQADVGVDCWDQRPVSFEQIAVKMATKTYQPVDHHGRKNHGRKNETSRADH